MHPQIDNVLARGDLDEMLQAVEAMEAAGLEAAEARDKLTRVQEAIKKVMHLLTLRITTKGHLKNGRI